MAIVAPDGGWAGRRVNLHAVDLVVASRPIPIILNNWRAEEAADDQDRTQGAGKAAVVE